MGKVRSRLQEPQNKIPIKWYIYCLGVGCTKQITSSKVLRGVSFLGCDNIDEGCSYHGASHVLYINSGRFIKNHSGNMQSNNSHIRNRVVVRIEQTDHAQRYGREEETKIVPMIAPIKLSGIARAI